MYYLILFTGIPDPFFESMKFNKFKNKYGDLVDDVEDLVMHGSQVSLAHVSSVKLISRNNFNTNSGVIKIDNHTKYSIVKRDDKDRSFIVTIPIMDRISYHLMFWSYFLLSR